MSRYVVGIDLGTTNCAAAFADTANAQHGILPFQVAQVVAEGQVEERSCLPSFLYVAGEHDVAPGSLALPWDPARQYAVGEFARNQGARVPGRLVTSAKSWLCHGGVDRNAAILPWAALADVPRLSPVDASARYLQHLREAWEHCFADAPLDEQHVILTVPASFDEVARELTVAAAEQAGLRHAVLLEEPQAAFYAWIQSHEREWEKELRNVRLVLVVDIGGGTTDFSLVRVQRQDERLTLDRLAVGDHILLGGDNVDVALARLLEPRLGEKLDSQRWHALTTQCRAVKEQLLGDDPPSELAVRVAGRGRGVVGSTRTAMATREEIERLVMDGFFPLVTPDATPRRTPRLGLQEWGLPFAGEPEVPRHLATFLRHHATDRSDANGERITWPDAVLFNGGALKPPMIRDRLRELLAAWNDGQAPTVLANPDLDLAVARGATYYGLVRRGLGVRIGGGSARAYYLGLASAGETPRDGMPVLCIVPRGMQEGEEVEITSPEFEVLTNRPASFPLYASSTRVGDRSSAVVAADPDSLTELPPIRTVLRFGRRLTTTKLPVHLVAKLTEIGTIEVWCRSVRTDHRWRLQFALRSAVAAPEGEGAVPTQTSAELEIDPERLAAAAAAVHAVFPPGDAAGASGSDAVGLVRELETALGTGKDGWPLAVIRRLWDLLWEGRAARAVDELHEARWLNLCGFLLRPGFGHDLDEWRIQNLWRLYREGLKFPRVVQCRVEWWGMWRRLAGGLSRVQQTELYNHAAPLLLPRLKRRTKGKRAAAGPQETREYWQLLASCERLPGEFKTELAETLLPAVAKGKASDPETWALGRLGARAPFSGPLNCVVPRATVEQWVERLLERDWRHPTSMVLAIVQLARCVGDRERDLDERLRLRVAERLRTQPNGDRAARLVTEFVPLEAQERARIFDESLPVGLHLRD